MEQTALHDKRGMTLLELMISLVLMTIVALALMQSSLVVMNNNVRNELRDEAVSVAEVRMNEGRNMSFDNLLTFTTPTSTTIYRNFRAVVNFPFTASLVTTPVNSTSAQVAVTVKWNYRGMPYNHSVSTVLRRK